MVKMRRCDQSDDQGHADLPDLLSPQAVETVPPGGCPRPGLGPADHRILTLTGGHEFSARPVRIPPELGFPPPVDPVDLLVRRSRFHVCSPALIRMTPPPWFPHPQKPRSFY